jgi:hypothetical protein
MTQNRTLFFRDPTSFVIPNDGVTEVSQPSTRQEWSVLRYELESFVCAGEYKAGMERVLSTFLGHLDQAKQPAVWVSGFYGSGKSHFVRALQYLWQDVAFPDGAQARSLVALPADIADQFRELSTAGKRGGGLWAAAGTLSAGADSIRLALLSIVFRAAGLPEQYAPARFVTWLRQKGFYDAVVDHVKAQGENLAGELNSMYVSPVLAKALLSACPDLGPTTKDVLAQVRAQFPQKPEITEAEMLQALEDVLALQSDKPGKWPLTLLVFDELQQSIGTDNDRTLQVQNIVQACSSRFGSSLLFVATGQAALEATPQLSKLQDRFTVRVTLSDKDVQQVIRQVVLRKAPGQVAALSAVLDAASGEINRHLGGTKIAPTMSDRDDLVPDYPLLPARRRFWERLLRAIDRPGTAAQLRTQLRIVHEANRSVAAAPVGTAVPADIIYEQQKSSMLQSGVLLSEVAAIIAEQNDGTADGALRARLCALIFLIGELPTEGVMATGVQATADMLADLLVEDLTAGSASLRQRIPVLLQQLVDNGLLMLVGGEYRLQTRESAEWERDRRARYQKIANDATRLASDRLSEFRTTVNAALKAVKLVQGASKVPRKFDLHFGLDAPSSGSDSVQVWIRDEWSVSEKTVREDAQAAGTESPVVFVLLPRRDAEALNAALAGLAAATDTLNGRPANQPTAEGIQARRAMETRRDLERTALDGLVANVLSAARVYQGGGNEVAENSFRESVEKTLNASLVRLFGRFGLADDVRWGTAVRHASQGAADALTALGFNGNADAHPVCKEVQGFIGAAGKQGGEVRKHFGGAGYGWPQDAVDGALLALVAGGQVEALDKTGKTVTAKEIDRPQIGQITFRNATTVITAIHRIGVRQLLTAVGLPFKNGEEGPVIPQLLQKLADLADDAGGPAPLPAEPDTSLVEDLLSRHGNEQFVAVYGARTTLQDCYTAWKAAKDLKASRQPRWQVLQRLLAHASSQPSSYQIRPQAEAVHSNRSLLANPDPVQPLIADLSNDLRAALKLARDRLVEARDRELAAFEKTDEWRKLSDEQWQKILRDNGLGPVEPLNVGTEEQLLATLDAKPLKTWEDWIVAVPARIAKAREQAAKLLEPQAVRVHPRSTTLRTATDVEVYLEELRTDIMAHIQAGKPVIV